MPAAKCPLCKGIIETEVLRCRLCQGDLSNEDLQEKLAKNIIEEELKQTVPIRRGEVYCNDCKLIDFPKRIVPGHFLIEVILWWCFLVPGLIYTVWRCASTYKGCKNCRSRHIRPASESI